MNKLTKNADGGRTGTVHWLQRRLTSLLGHKLPRHLMEVRPLYPRKQPRRPFAIEAAKGQMLPRRDQVRMSAFPPKAAAVVAERRVRFGP
jgi:hypothetical protein